MPSITLAASLRVALVRLNRRMRREQGDEALSIHHMSALGAIQQLEQPTLARIAACEGVQPPSMVKTLQHLESLGYIEREAHPTDGRMQVLRISDKGEEMIAELRERRNRALAEALDRLTPEEREIVERAVPILERLAER
ncbi:MarR family winged helix-turn-helix transcriptional regulator [Agrococcus baldri]|uniref:MarR family transcriptional regulator n=1 Tax=Agrococcus baldri TaxID=153730 RepID=A0AA87RAB7_9MICO|nr:MarR family transcriptional regulator [Agrococcus baldri]GEK79012.1 MarR family transcriptional regulator [Agrococcus baldri]